ncbi:lipopolysaccharide export system permease protein [Methylohalomonas lacus]|uniref:Lipopolysaccharide export system permease protein n=1 Tax=Methylohalomonas lacus TaxID=398773 RepID=A0AAE3L0K7_9GAMM|nr:LPS export ABC transporter permease LptG [Methylohalomonas lacus]MCS3902170.1 lipopolysaccharide export system permease protein [Methylohalomonas lacus]
MVIIDRYLGTMLIRTTALVLFVLMLLFAFFSLIDQLEDTGRGAFGVYNAFEYVALTMPRTVAELFPIAAVIGAMTTLGLFARNSELTVIRAAGVSRNRVLYGLLKGGLVLAVVAVMLAEIVAPPAEQAAQKRRSVALSEQISTESRYGFWVRDGNSYINIRTLLPDDEFRDIYIYEFDGSNRLRFSTHAERAHYRDGEWRLFDLQQTVIDREKVRQKAIESADWDTQLNPDVINLVVVKPEHLGLFDLREYIDYLAANNQNTLRYRQALWSKIVYPFSILVLIALAVPLVKAEARSGAIGQRIFIGTLIGILFHIVNQAMSHLGVVFKLSPVFSAALPSVVIFVVTLWLIRRSH